jgi:hypothetical protein
MKLKHTLAALCAGHFALSPVFAAELPVGTVISAANYEQVKNDTFAGKTIASMVPEVVEYRIKNWGLKVTLDNAKPLEPDPSYVAATKKYSGDVKFDPKTGEVTNYKAGMPFPDISMDDPYAGNKLLWNFYYAPMEGNRTWMTFGYLLVDGGKGVERTQDWFFTRYGLKGMLDRDNPVEGDSTVLTKSIIVATAPRDVRGLGLFTIRNDSAAMENSWAYIKSARRTRQVSGGAWMDPIGGTDQLNDDLYLWNARPSWYPKYKILAKRWILAISDAPSGWNPSKKGTPEEYPLVDQKTAPYWNSLHKWQPREVYVVEATAPAEHPYSKKVVYIDAHVPKIYMIDIYDKQGKLWKHHIANVGLVKGEDGYKAISASLGSTIVDFKLKHATVFVGQKLRVNPKGMKATDVSLEALESNSQ